MAVNGFTSLDIWQMSKELTIKIYEKTSSFPKEEKYGIIDQIRRSSSSIGANIAEGYGRYYTKEYIKFLYNSRGSLEETKHFLILSKDLNYISENEFKEFFSTCNFISAKINKLIKSLFENIESRDKKSITVN